MEEPWRGRRSASQEGQVPTQVGDELLQFYLGFKLDGFDEYNNLSETHPDKVLQPFLAPSITPTTDIILFNPNTDKYIHIKVNQHSFIIEHCYRN